MKCSFVFFKRFLEFFLDLLTFFFARRGRETFRARVLKACFTNVLKFSSRGGGYTEARFGVAWDEILASEPTNTRIQWHKSGDLCWATLTDPPTFSGPSTLSKEQQTRRQYTQKKSVVAKRVRFEHALNHVVAPNQPFDKSIPFDIHHPSPVSFS